jgi:hypothetical protein
VRHCVQMLLGIFAARGVLPLQREPVADVQDLVWQHLDDLQAEAEAKGGLEQVLADHYAKAFKVASPRDLVLPVARDIA